MGFTLSNVGFEPAQPVTKISYGEGLRWWNETGYPIYNYGLMFDSFGVAASSSEYGWPYRIYHRLPLSIFSVLSCMPSL